VQSLGLQLGGSKAGAVLHIRLHTAQNQSAGVVIQQAGKKQHGTFRNDGTRYRWQLDFDPAANGGRGRVTFRIKSELPEHESWEDQPFVVDLPAGYRQHGTVFDRFGMINATKPGGKLPVYFGELHHDGVPVDLTKDPRWDSAGNRTSMPKGDAGANDFGFSESAHAGGKSGEAGGTLWRMGRLWASYADRIGPVSMDDRLEASGRVMLEVGAPDSGLFFGWFHSGGQAVAPDQAGSFLGVKIAGPSRAGHYFAPALTTADGKARTSGKGPLLIPGKPYEWSLVYDPTANDGVGAITVKLGDETFSFDLKKNERVAGGQFDRFGLFSIHNDGGHAPAKIFFDDLRYTAGAPP
jgi:hypothetical protein